MKRKVLSLILAICLALPCVLTLGACNKEPSANTGTVYTVTESEWEINFNITKGKPQAQSLSSDAIGNQVQLFSSGSPRTLDEITSYTLFAEGDSEGQNGSGLLKVAPNGMYMEFYLDGVLSGDKNGVTPATDPFYVGMTRMLKSYFPFSGKYNDFTFDQTKNAYVAQNIKSTVVDESDITKTYDLFNKIAEIKFVNGYLNTITVEMCEDDTYENVYLSLVFTFSDINRTVVNV